MGVTIAAGITIAATAGTVIIGVTGTVADAALGAMNAQHGGVGAAMASVVVCGATAANQDSHAPGKS